MEGQSDMFSQGDLSNLNSGFATDIKFSCRSGLAEINDNSTITIYAHSDIKIKEGEYDWYNSKVSVMIPESFMLLIVEDEMMKSRLTVCPSSMTESGEIYFIIKNKGVAPGEIEKGDPVARIIPMPTPSPSLFIENLNGKEEEDWH